MNKKDDNLYNATSHFHFISHTTRPTRTTRVTLVTTDSPTEAPVQHLLEERLDENLDDPGGDHRDPREQHEQHEQREQREQRTIEENYEIDEEKEEIITISMNLILLISNVSVASVAKASTLSTPYKMFFLSIYLPPSSFVVSMSVLHKQRAKVVVLIGLPRHSTIAPRGIKINVLNVKTLFYSISSIFLTITVNKLNTKYLKFKFICQCKMVSHHQLIKYKQYTYLSYLNHQNQN